LNYFFALIFFRRNTTKVDAPKNRGDFNDCLPYENLYIEPVINFKQSGNWFDNNYFFAAESIFFAAESILLAALSIFATAESTTAGIAALIESAVLAESAEAVAEVSAELLQATNEVAIAKTKSNFFIF